MSVQCVSDMQTKRDSLFNLFESDSEAKRKFPGEQFVLHAEFANFFHPMSDSLPGEGNERLLLHYWSNNLQYLEISVVQ